MGFVHNDIKLENIVVGFEDPNRLYLIDFGLTQKYLTGEGKHVEKKALNKFSGNFLFGSLNSCRGYNKSRRDDVESIFYVLIFLLNHSYLPWNDFEKLYKGASIEFRDLLQKRMHIQYTKRLFSMIPSKYRIELTLQRSLQSP